MFSPLASCNPTECVYVVQDGGSWKLEMGRRSVAADVDQFQSRGDQCLLELVDGLAEINVFSGGSYGGNRSRMVT